MMDHATQVTEPVKTEWAWFVALGCVLVGCGSIAIVLALFSTMLPTLVLSRVLALGGAFQIVHSFRLRSWSGFIWDLLIGLIQVLGGILIHFDPFTGVVAITGVVALIFLMLALIQVGLAFKVRPHDGWGWLLGSGLVARPTLWLAFRWSLRERLTSRSDSWRNSSVAAHDCAGYGTSSRGTFDTDPSRRKLCSPKGPVRWDGELVKPYVGAVRRI
jgi:uncharacterized membrane protein HdeD (DUF308 family)